MIRLAFSFALLVATLSSKHAGYRFSERRRKEMAKKRMATLANAKASGKDDPELARKIKKFRDENESWLDEDVIAEEIEIMRQSHADEKRRASRSPVERREERERERERKAEERLVRDFEKAERSRFFQLIKTEFQGIRPTPGLDEEYRAVPKVYRNPDGFGGDDVAMILANDYPEFGIESEQDLLDYFNERIWRSYQGGRRAA